MRIGATWSSIWWNHLLNSKQAPPPGHKNHQTNTGVFIIRPGDHYMVLPASLVSYLPQIRRSFSICWTSLSPREWRIFGQSLESRAGSMRSICGRSLILGTSTTCAWAFWIEGCTVKCTMLPYSTLQDPNLSQTSVKWRNPWRLYAINGKITHLVLTVKQLESSTFIYLITKRISNCQGQKKPLLLLCSRQAGRQAGRQESR